MQDKLQRDQLEKFQSRNVAKSIPIVGRIDESESVFEVPQCNKASIMNLM